MQCNCQNVRRILILREEEVGSRLLIENLEGHSNANFNHVSGTMRQDTVLSATLGHPDVVSTSGHCHSCHPINTTCCLTFASRDDGAVFVWQATCFYLV